MQNKPYNKNCENKKPTPLILIQIIPQKTAHIKYFKITSFKKRPSFFLFSQLDYNGHCKQNTPNRRSSHQLKHEGEKNINTIQIIKASMDEANRKYAHENTFEIPHESRE